MKIFKYLPPYQQNGKTTYPDRERAGVYLIRENGVLVYVGESHNNVYRTLYRHFQTWSSKYQKVNTYADRMKKNKYTVRVIYCTAKQAWSLEKSLIKKHSPRDNAELYKQYKLEFYDKNTLQALKNTAIEEDVPF